MYLFIFWKKLKEDFYSEVIFRIGFNILIGLAIGILFALKFAKPYFLWAGFTGGMLGLAFTLIKFKFKFYEVLEAFIIAILPWLGFVYLFDSVRHSSFSSFLGFLAILILILVSYFIGAHYKNFNWYKSGKMGFTGLAILIIMFFARSVLALLSVSMLSLVNSRVEILISGLGFVSCLILLVRLSLEKD